MAKDVNIHVKTTGTGQAKSELDQMAHSTEELGVKSSRAAGWMREAFSALVGPLGIAGIVAIAVSGIHRIIAAFDDMKKAAAEAVQELANQQRAARTYLEAMGAYSPEQSKEAIAQAKKVSGDTGIPLEASMQILEAQKRAFGEINPKATEQFAAYWQLHTEGGPAATDLIRWMAQSGVKTPERQDKIMRTISAVAQKNKLKDEEIISVLQTQGERFRYLGWTPEQMIENIGKVIVPGEGPQRIQRLFAAIEGFTEQKARELEWVTTKAVTMTPEKRADYMQKAFGITAPYIKRLFEPTTATIPVTTEEERRRFIEWQETEEAEAEKDKNKTVQPGAGLTPEEKQGVRLRKYGKDYLENYLRIHDRLKYEKIKAIPGGEEYQYELAAKDLWSTVNKPIIGELKRRPGVFGDILGLPETIPILGSTWEETPIKERFAGVEKASHQINISHHYHHDTYYGQRVGGDGRGPRTDPNNLGL
jgi:hypothetical protein